MNLLFRLLLVIIIILETLVNSNNQTTSKQISDRDKLWEKISQFFSPPEEYRNKYGNYRSPLKFYSGKLVESPKEWDIRRKEIFDRWHEMMGNWPPLIEKQKLEILETTLKEGYLQHRIIFEWLPGQKTESYLLMPHGSVNRPAVITVFYEPETAIAKDGLRSGEFRDFALQLAKRGFVTLSLVA